MEESLSLAELTAIVGAARDRERAAQKFAAALKGIDLDENSSEDSEDMFKRAENKAKAMLSGKSETEVEFEDLGMGIEIE